MLQTPLIWAQRKEEVIITVQVHDAVNVEVYIEESTIKYKSSSVAKDEVSEWTVELFDLIDPNNSRFCTKPRGTEIILKKKNIKWWPRLSKSEHKLTYVGVDWSRWLDSDEADERKPRFE